MDDTRFFSFVPSLYLRELQQGLQTAHAVSEMYTKYRHSPGPKMDWFDSWAENDKTIMIKAAANHEGVLDAFEKIKEFAEHFNLPFVLFNEDTRSMNGMATSASVIVPKDFYDGLSGRLKLIKTGDPEYYEYTPLTHFPDRVQPEPIIVYDNDSMEYRFCKFLTGYGLAR